MIQRHSPATERHLHQEEQMQLLQLKDLCFYQVHQKYWQIWTVYAYHVQVHALDALPW